MNSAPRILLIEDNPGDSDFIIDLLTARGAVNFHVETTTRLSDALKRLNEETFEVALLDLGLPDSHGLPTFHLLHRAMPTLPIIVLTGTDDHDLALTAVREGAQDFLVKGLFNQSLLTRSIRYAIERQKSQASMHQFARDLHILTARLQNVREEERATLARELHDTLGQHLTALQISLIWMDRHLQSNGPPDLAALSDRIAAMVPIVERLTDDTQAICSSLRSPILDDLGLVAAIQWQVEETTKMSGLDFALSLPNDEDLELDSETALALFRIVQEAITNVVRHAKATLVEILLATHDESLELTIKDNGCGADRETRPQSIDLGLLGMRERAATLGGTVDFISQPDHGATVRVTIPHSNHSRESRSAP